jgi:hypothetical protein
VSFETIPGSFVPGHGTTLVSYSYYFLDTTASLGTWYYRLKQRDRDGTVHFTGGIRIEVTSGIDTRTNPTDFALHENYPNPFNPATTIGYDVVRSSWVTLKVYDMLGQEIATLVNETKPAGAYKVQLDAKNLAGGVYFYRLRAGSFVQTKKLMLLR